ncbi:hypothetical protein HYC85_006200 [Camellia sinensis]|uniref:Uncharacterized protein n=1 Tax=Camellia sinensis TaxID=4442 RepID=A0A7J7HMZ8_CAMSI|nr:hypothetical protein HYC85_006200 [Camellia sinensis]
MRPSYNPKRPFEENNVSIPKSNDEIQKPITQLWHLNGDCPTKKEDVLRASSIKSFGKKTHRTILEPPRSVEPDLDKQGGGRQLLSNRLNFVGVTRLGVLALVHTVPSEVVIHEWSINEFSATISLCMDGDDSISFNIL